MSSAERGNLTDVVLTCGGTGGHVSPAVAIASEIARRHEGVALSFIVRPDSYESRALGQAGYELDLLSVGRLVGQSVTRTLKTLVGLPLAVLSARKMLRRRRPQVVIGTGGFVSGPAMLAAALSGFPTLVHEQNAVAGLTNRVLAKVVSKVALSHPRASAPSKMTLTGNPVRPEFFSIAPWEERTPFRLLIMGGSQGAVALNRTVLAAAPLLADLEGRLEIVWQCGQRHGDAMRAEAERLGVSLLHVRPFLDDVAEELERAQLVACRAGASTVSEICAAGRPSILVPFPAAAGDHQTANAKAMEEAGAAELRPESELTPEWLAQRVRALVEDPTPLSVMAQAASQLARPDAAGDIADLAEAIARPMERRAA
ncbi:MAG: undecaprenyldiphospho-muramoylpentapeptide beta-N-acetylglucosaminyltransferase [Acidobacteriota bacterium]